MKKALIEEFLKENNGYITSGELEELGISRVNIPKLIQKGILRKVAHGLYIDHNLIEDEYYILQKRYNHIIFSHNTALHLWQLSERAPYELDVTTYYDKKIRDELENKYYIKDLSIVDVPSILVFSSGELQSIYRGSDNRKSLWKSN